MGKIVVLAILLFCAVGLFGCTDNSPRGVIESIQEATIDGDHKQVFTYLDDGIRDRNLNWVSIGFLTTASNGNVTQKQFDSFNVFDKSEDPLERFLGYCELFGGKEICGTYVSQGSIKEVKISEKEATFLIGEQEVFLKKVDGKWLVAEGR